MTSRLLALLAAVTAQQAPGTVSAGGEPAPAPTPVPAAPVADAAPCADMEDECAKWTAQGECTNNPGFMKRRCARSCGLCGEAEGRPSPAAATSVEVAQKPEPAARRELTHTTATGAEGTNTGYSVSDNFVPAPTDLPLGNVDRHLPGPFSSQSDDTLTMHLPNSILATSGYDAATGMQVSSGLLRVPSHHSGHGYTTVGEAQWTTTTSKLPPQICTAWITPQEAFKPQTPDRLKKYRPHSNSDYDYMHPVNNPENPADGAPGSNSPNVDFEGDVHSFPSTPDADLSYTWDTSHPPHAIYKIDGSAAGDQPAPDPAWGNVNHASSQFGCGYCVCDFCKTPARNLSEYVPLTANVSLDADGIPRHRLGPSGDRIVNYTDGDDAMYPKWYTIEATQVARGTGSWDAAARDWNVEVTNGEDPQAAPQDEAPALFELPWITNPLDTCRCPRWDECNHIQWTQTSKYCSHHASAANGKRGTWVWIASDCECDAAYNCTTPAVDGSPGDTCNPGKCYLESPGYTGGDWVGTYSFKGCYKSLAFPSTQFSRDSLTDLQAETLNAAAIATAINLDNITGHGSSSLTVPKSQLVDHCALEPVCVPQKTDAILEVLETRGLEGSEAPVPPCVVGTDGNGKQAIEVNLLWFVVREIRANLM